MKYIRFLLLSLALVVPRAVSATPSTERIRLLPTVPLEIRAGGRTLRFTVEVAKTVGEQARGLMYRRSIPVHGGMIFPMRPPRFASFWMKNTLVPLDLLFIRADGRVGSIAPQARPLSLDPIMSSEPVAAVLELRGGTAAKLGIQPGALVTSPALR